MVVLKDEAGRRKAIQIARATIYFEDLVTIPANEMVVMVLSCHLVSSWFTRELDRNEPSLLDELFNCTIDGGDA